MEKVLIIDDDRNICNILNEYLSNKRFEIKCTSCGKTGKKALEEEVFDYVLLDLVMPDCEGMEILNKIRGLLIKPKTIVISGYQHWSNMAITLGADQFLSKPFQLEQLDVLMGL